MSHWTKNIAVVLSAAILLSGSGFTAGYAAAIEHDLGIEKSVDGQQEGGAGRDTHGCAAHFTAHLLTLPGTHVLWLPVRHKAVVTAFLRVRVVPSIPDSFFHPPRISLA